MATSAIVIGRIQEETAKVTPFSSSVPASSVVGPGLWPPIVIASVGSTFAICIVTLLAIAP